MKGRGLSSETIQLRCDEDVSKARILTGKLCVEYGFSALTRTRAMTATSEIARNCVLHGKGGMCRFDPFGGTRRHGFRVEIADYGDGIADAQLAESRGFTTGSGLGLGLGGARRLCSQFEIKTSPGKGTCVTLGFWR